MPDQVRTFTYRGPDAEGARDRGATRGKSYDLITNNVVISTVQVMQKGVGNTLHYHNDEDGYWLILGGRARFHGVGEQVLAELGRYEGIVIPRTTRYWFASGADEPLEILRVSHHGEGHADAEAAKHGD
jgi:mannose-6-phosphate isomerase-like protein (cupin superfamily)